MYPIQSFILLFRIRKNLHHFAKICNICISVDICIEIREKICIITEKSVYVASLTGRHVTWRDYSHLASSKQSSYVFRGTEWGRLYHFFAKTMEVFSKVHGHWLLDGRYIVDKITQIKHAKSQKPTLHHGRSKEFQQSHFRCLLSRPVVNRFSVQTRPQNQDPTSNFDHGKMENNTAK